MCEATYNPTQFALEIEFEERIETVLRRHTAVLCWNEAGVSPIADRKDSATCCLIQTEELRFAVTCAHVWQGFQDAAKKGADNLWLGLVRSDDTLAPVLALKVHNPTLKGAHQSFDLAPFTFDEINSLEPWRFHHLRHRRREQVASGEGVFFLASTGDELRGASANCRLGYTRFALTVAGVSYGQFQLHDPPGSRHQTDRRAEEIQPQRITGVSGAPVFRLGNLGPSPLDLALAGVVSGLSSPGLSGSSQEPIGIGSVG